MSEESKAYLYELISDRISDLYCQVDDGVIGADEELEIALEAQRELN